METLIFVTLTAFHQKDKLFSVHFWEFIMSSIFEVNITERGNAGHTRLYRADFVITGLNRNIDLDTHIHKTIACLHMVS